MRKKIAPYIQPAFLICVTVLAMAGGGMQVAIDWFGVQLKKEAIPLKRPLDLLSEAPLAPYTVVQKRRIQNKDILEQLGTEEYIQLTLEDTEAEKLSPVRYCSMFITYYTGDPDMVPHVPEECYIGGGNVCLSRESVTIELKEPYFVDIDTDTVSVGIEGSRDINVRFLVFSRKSSDIWEASSKFAVWYVFKVNGRYADSRWETRKILGENLFGRYSYFSKIEWSFYRSSSGGNRQINKEAGSEASKKLLSVILPILEGDYWPDWEKANREEDVKIQDAIAVSVK